jgi:hypothetical protein
MDTMKCTAVMHPTIIKKFRDSYHTFTDAFTQN